jgi:hypothetical protein
LLKTVIDPVELRPNGLRMILSLVPLTPAAALPVATVNLWWPVSITI